MSTKTTFKRIALVAVAALGFGVLSVAPSQADVTGLTITATNGTGASVLKSGESATAASLNIQFLSLDAARDSVTVTIVPAAALPTDATIAGAGLFFTDSATSSGTLPRVDTETTQTLTYATAKAVERRGAITLGSYFRVVSGDAANATQSVTVKYSLGETTTAGNAIKAGTYSFNAVVVSRQAGVAVTQVVPFSIAVAAAPVAVKAVPAAASAKAYIQATTTYPTVAVFADSATAGSFVAGTVVGTIRASNFSSTDVAANDTFTVTMTGNGYLKTVAPAAAITGRSFTVIDTSTLTLEVVADGASGTGTVTIKTEAGASFVKTVTFFDTKPSKAVATVKKAFPKAGGTTTDAIGVVVTDVLGNAITAGGVTLAAAPTDTATTVGGASQVFTWDTTEVMYMCPVVGKAADKFGPVAYTITATGTGINILAKVTTTATVTFADNVATKAVLAGPATATPGASVEYTLTLTEKNGYAVADQTYGVNPAAASGLFASAVTSGWLTAPFSTADSFTSVSGVLTSKGVMGIAGVGTGTWTLIGDGLQTLATSAIDKTIGKTKVTVSTEVTNPGVDAATDAANEATDAANAATDAALAAAEAADAATTAAQEASDAVAALSESVTKLIAGLQAQIKSLAAVVAKIAKKVKA